jgi:hypothetical protein
MTLSSSPHVAVGRGRRAHLALGKRTGVAGGSTPNDSSARPAPFRSRVAVTDIGCRIPIAHRGVV